MLPQTLVLQLLVAGIDPAQLEAFVDARAAAQPEACRTPGLAVVVIEGGNRLLSRGYGYANVERKIAVDPDKTLFRVASVTKSLTAFAVMQLVEMQALDIGEDLSRFSPGPPFDIGHLLTHTAGLDNSWIGCGARNGVNIGEHVRLHPRDRFMRPGLVPSYNNHHYVLAGHIVEALSGSRYQDYMRDRVFRPLGMLRTTFEASPEAVPDFARPYEIDGDVVTPAFEVPPNHDIPAGGVITTAGDMGRYLLVHLQAIAGARSPVLGPEGFRRMHETQFAAHPAIPGVTFGFIERFQGNHRVLSSEGAFPGFVAQMELVPNVELGVFAVSNVASERCPITYEIAGEIVDEFYPSQPIASTTQVDEKRIEQIERIERVSGRYRSLRRTWATFEKALTLLGATREETVAPLEKGAIQIGQSRYAEIEPYVFRRADGNRTVKFISDDSGMLMTFGIDSYQQISWYDTTLLHTLLLLGCVSVFLLAIVRRSTPKLARATALCAILFPMAVALSSLGPDGRYWIADGVPVWFRAVLALPVLSGLLAIMLLVKHRSRVVAISGLIFAGIAIYWNLLPWKV